MAAGRSAGGTTCAPWTAAVRLLGPLGRARAVRTEPWSVPAGHARAAHTSGAFCSTVDGSCGTSVTSPAFFKIFHTVEAWPRDGRVRPAHLEFFDSPSGDSHAQS